MSNAGGAATTGGIEFQHRIGALALIQLFFQPSSFPDYITKDQILSIRFETDDKIDDIVVNCENHSIFIQAKRSINLSDNLDSEFSGVIRQFVGQHIVNPNANDKYILATTARASGKIKNELMKLTESHRLNSSSADENPLTQSEIQVQKISRELIECHFYLLTNENPTRNIIDTIFKKIFIKPIEVEDGESDERVLFGYLSSSINIQPSLFWSAILSKVIDMAKKRQSIDKHGIVELYQKFAIQNSSKNDATSDEWNFKFLTKGDFPAAKEVVAIRHDDNIIISEFARFSSDGSPTVTFSENRITFNDGGSFELIARAGTHKGMSRYLDDNAKDFLGLNVYISSNNDDAVDYSNPHSIAHAAICSESLLNKAEKHKCIVCADAISEDGAYLVEIDEDLRPFEIGNIHKACYKSQYRIIGAIDSAIFRTNGGKFRNFDYPLWYTILREGQGIIGGTAHISSLKHIFWKGQPLTSGLGNWCIQVLLEDGGVMYVFERGRTLRLSEIESNKYVDIFNAEFDSKRNERDPCCYSSISSTFGPYSVVSRVLQPGETVANCVSACKSRFTKEIDTAYSRIKNFYAPLIAFYQVDTDEILKFRGGAVFLSDPLTISSHIDNWKRCGFEIPDIKTLIIKDDAEFDRILSSIESPQCVGFIDLLIDANFEPISGLAIFRFNDQAKSNNQ